MGALNSNRDARIIVLRGGALGDCLVSVPALRLLRDHFPNAHITLVGSHYSGPIFQSCSHIDRLILLDHYQDRIRYLRDLFDLRRERPDLVIDFQDAGRSRFQTFLMRGKRRIGFDTRPSVARIIYTDQVHLDKSVHVTRRITNLLAPLGLQVTHDVYPGELELGDINRLRAAEILRRNGISEAFAFLQVTTGARPEHRTWPLERFVQVAEHLYRGGLNVVIASSIAQEKVRWVVDQSRSPVHAIYDPLDNLALAGIIERSKIYVGYNTGPMHIAAALGVKIVALFDVPTDAVEWSPATAAPFRIVQAKPFPEPPGWRLDTVEVDEVTEAVDSMADAPLLNSVRA